MKLKNKCTGEIRTLCVDIRRPDNGIRVYADDGVCYKMYNSLTELNEEWEDYEEGTKTVKPIMGEVYNAISTSGKVREETWNDYGFDRGCFEIGNYFATKEEGELAVEKLKAWKRLKDAGFKFTWWSTRSGSDHDGEYEGEFVMFSECDDYVNKDDLDLLFRGEE